MSAENATLHREQLVNLLGGLVPLYMITLGRRGISQERVDAALEVISSSGDAFEPGGVRSTDARRSLLGALAEAIAILTLTRPEGIDLFGAHWCADHTTHDPDEEEGDASPPHAP